MPQGKPIKWSFTEILATTRIFLKERWLWAALVLILPVGLGFYHIITGAPLGAKGGAVTTHSSASPFWGGLAMVAFGLTLLIVAWTMTHLSRFMDGDNSGPPSPGTKP